MNWGGPRGSLPPRAARALSVVLLWVAGLVLGAYALGLLTAWALWH